MGRVHPGDDMAVRAGRDEVLDVYDASHLIGLNVVVVDAARRIVDDDGEEYISVPMIEELAQAAAVARCLLPVRIKGGEMKAIRKIADMTARELAGRLGEKTAPETVSRWESGAQPIGGYVEKVFRLVICEELKSQAPAIDYCAKTIAEMRVEDPIRSVPDYEIVPIVFRLVKVKIQGGQPAQNAWDTAPPIAA